MKIGVFNPQFFWLRGIRKLGMRKKLRRNEGKMALVYIVEDDRNIREIETFALKNTGYEVKDFECAQDFYRGMERKKPDIILLDIMLPDEDGLEIVKKLRAAAETGKIPVIMVTAKASEIDKVKGLDIGADDYMTKPFGVMELISRVKALLRRSLIEEERPLHIGSVCLDGERHLVTVDGMPCELTYKEYELLKLLMNRAGIVATRDMILDRIWGTVFFNLFLYSVLKQKEGEYIREYHQRIDKVRAFPHHI